MTQISKLRQVLYFYQTAVGHCSEYETTLVLLLNYHVSEHVHCFTVFEQDSKSL